MKQVGNMKLYSLEEVTDEIIGYSISIPTMSLIFNALGIATATLDLGIAGKVAL